MQALRDVMCLLFHGDNTLSSVLAPLSGTPIFFDSFQTRMGSNEVSALHLMPRRIGTVPQSAMAMGGKVRGEHQMNAEYFHFNSFVV